jgi:CheY-like chemotaxis protein
VTTKPLGELKVLVVDDNGHAVKLITQILRGFGIRDIGRAEDGVRALAVLDAGINEFLAKPLSPAAVLQRITSVLVSPREFINVDAG